MHISEGVLSGQVLLAGGVIAAVGTAVGLKKMDYEKVANVGILSSVFFVVSFIHIPLGPSNVHLILNGLLGILLGWTVFPAVLVALTLQAVFFQFGGITVLGVNTVIMAFPALICYYLFKNFINGKHGTAMVASFSCGFLSVLVSGTLLGLALIAAEENFFEVALLVIMTNIPVMIIEGIVTAFSISFLRKVGPEMLSGGD